MTIKKGDQRHIYKVANTIMGLAEHRYLLFQEKSNGKVVQARC